ncbi:hypothetical protein BDA96_02G450900 [Sorghum bicolor]|uniref:Uncharacterized protein n=2 Tax=Sorghum bicolor TaxID=4558 RepID=A0A1B6QGJ7_SORBI|nr:hypothetical protein BDA96_02G450900 [Sorghum bicolor]KXG37045.1 hypothetical protein SORBI_3002G430400 [Sorghum bicolor]KXG37046.1 hypothetical protein SORBI_3002G430400 [Sorghum bicolor]OQU90560.1 hypothetical protein SORBI_3002G430400 [Sorghum bicolor]
MALTLRCPNHITLKLLLAPRLSDPPCSNGAYRRPPSSMPLLGLGRRAAAIACCSTIPSTALRISRRHSVVAWLQCFERPTTCGARPLEHGARRASVPAASSNPVLHSSQGLECAAASGAQPLGHGGWRAAVLPPPSVRPPTSRMLIPLDRRREPDFGFELNVGDACDVFDKMPT